MTKIILLILLAISFSAIGQTTTFKKAECSSVRIGDFAGLQARGDICYAIDSNSNAYPIVTVANSRLGFIYPDLEGPQSNLTFLFKDITQNGIEIIGKSPFVAQDFLTIFIIKGNFSNCVATRGGVPISLSQFFMTDNGVNNDDLTCTTS